MTHVLNKKNTICMYVHVYVCGHHYIILSKRGKVFFKYKSDRKVRQ